MLQVQDILAKLSTYIKAQFAYIQAVYTLLKHGAKQKSSMRGATPLWVAAEYNRPEITQLLINFGGDPNVQMPHSGGTPLLRAIIRFYHKNLYNTQAIFNARSMEKTTVQDCNMIFSFLSVYLLI